MSNDPKNHRPLTENLPTLQIVEAEDTRKNRLEELGNLLNKIGGWVDPEKPKTWN